MEWIVFLPRLDQECAGRKSCQGYLRRLRNWWRSTKCDPLKPLKANLDQQGAQKRLRLRGVAKPQASLISAQTTIYAGCIPVSASRSRFRAVCSRRLIVPTGLANSSLICFKVRRSK